MQFKQLSFLFFIVISVLNIVQAQDKEVLFTVDNRPVYASEFIRVYNKNLDLVIDDSQKNIDNYLKLFIEYKLKLLDAKRLKLREKPSYLRELKNHKKQLVKNYITDNKVTDALVEEAYNRLQSEIKASHILVLLDENASPKDTLVAYNKIAKLRERVINEGYAPVQKEVHDGKTIFAEDLGYFSAFKMVYAFENAAYSTDVGQVSRPFRTRFGYHIVTVFDIRKTKGQVSVAHIMIKTDAKNNKDSEIKINEIYQRIQQGEAFDALAKQFSEDKGSSSKGGLLKPFSNGEIRSPKFEEVAFGLQNTEAVSKPFKTQFGWHIVKLKDKKRMAPLADMKSELKSKVKRDSRSKVISDSRINTLKLKYAITENTAALSYFKSILNTDFFANRWKLPANFKANKPLVKIGEKAFTYNHFGQFLLINQPNFNKNPTEIPILTNTLYARFLEIEMLNYQEENLIKENSDYAQIVDDFEAGLLLFDIMETKIWNVSKNDTIALKKFYNANKANYYLPERVDAVVASSAKKSIIKKTGKLMTIGKDINSIKSLVNTNNQVNISFSSGIMDKNHQALPNKFIFKEGISKIYSHNGAYVVVKVKEIFPKSLQSFEKSKGEIIADYQIFKEQKWLKELALKYTIKVNQAVLNKVKDTLKHEYD